MALRQSARSRRMERQERNARGGELSLVSLMDIFTILVFFLLVNAGEVEVLPAPRGLLLPESAAEQRTRASVVIQVSREEVQVRGQRVMSMAELERGPDGALPALKAALGSPAPAADGGPPPLVTLMSDRSIPYRQLRKVLLSCTAAGYSHIALAVTQRPGS